MYRRLTRVAALTAALSWPLAGVAADCAADAMLVFDGSGSMVEFGYDYRQTTRIAEARLAVARAIPQVAPFRRIGLLVYGPNTGDSCSGVTLKFPPRPDAAEPIISEVRALNPGGLTPLANSVRAAAEVLDFRQRPGVIVVVTDGNETCGGRPCATAAALAGEAQDLTIHVIGFRAVVDFWTWDNPEQERGKDMVAQCLAQMTGGRYVKTETVDELVEALNATLGCPLFGALRPRTTLPG